MYKGPTISLVGGGGRGVVGEEKKIVKNNFCTIEQDDLKMFAQIQNTRVVKRNAKRVETEKWQPKNGGKKYFTKIILP